MSHDYTSVCPTCGRIAFADKHWQQPMCSGTPFQPHAADRMVPWAIRHPEQLTVTTPSKD